jgi:chemotaxis protein MotB
MLLRPCSLAALALVALSAVGCGIPKEQYDRDMAALRQKSGVDLEAQRQAAEGARLQAEAAEKDRLARAAEELDRNKRALEQCTSKGGDATKNLATCQIERDEAKSKLDRVTADVNKVRDMLKSMQDAGKLQVKVERGFLVIALQGDILFDSGKSKLKEEAKPVLIELAEVLKIASGRLFQVAGHTDNTGLEDKNWELSIERAVNVVQFLIKQGGVDGKGLSAGGYAFYQPIADNATEEGRQVNRRVEFLLVPNLGELLNLK